jgi:hypothetical protein
LTLDGDPEVFDTLIGSEYCKLKLFDFKIDFISIFERLNFFIELNSQIKSIEIND